MKYFMKEKGNDQTILKNEIKSHKLEKNNYYHCFDTNLLKVFAEKHYN